MCIDGLWVKVKCVKEVFNGMGSKGKSLVSIKGAYVPLKYVLLVMVSLIFIFPIFYMVSLSFQSPQAIAKGYLLPDWELKNWSIVLSPSWLTSLQNAFIITISSVVLTFVISFPSAYTFSRYHFTGDKHIFFWLLMNRMTPASALLLPYLIIYLGIGLYNTIIAVVLAYFIFNIPLGVWIFTSYMGSIPREIDEQAFVDGYGLLRFFKDIFIPLCRPAISVVVFFIWYQSWSEMFIASIITRYDTMPLNARLFMLLDRSAMGADPGLSSAVGVLTCIPGLILLYWARTYLSKGFTLGRL